jgi:hypothetical protein
MTGLLSQFLSAVGTTEEVHTLVDFYQYIKVVEYLICVGFFVGFPMLYKYIHHPPEEP